MRPRTLRGFSTALFAAALLGAGTSAAATLPQHEPLRVLVVSDEVNPHNLAPAEITQRGDISAALNAENSGLTLAAPVTEVFSQCIDDALAVLAAAEPPDVVVYFAHMAALGCDGRDQEAALIAAFQAQLQRGGGIVVLHHGSYDWPGKDDMLALLGVSASGITWDTTVGQRVFNIAPNHFVTTNGLTYVGSAALTGNADVPSGTFDYFDNIPDERYPDTLLLEEAGENRTLLFASNSGTTRVLGYALERTGWAGRVVFYQPAEYQPNALDDRDGPNFQILANAIVYSARLDTPTDGGAGQGGTGNGGNAASGTAAGGNAGTGGTSGGVANGGRAGESANAGIGGSTSGSANAGSGARAGGDSGTAGTIGGTPAGTGGHAGSSGMPSTGGSSIAGSSSAGASPTSAAPERADGGCGCHHVRSDDSAGSALRAFASLFALGLLASARRRKMAISWLPGRGRRPDRAAG